MSFLRSIWFLAPFAAVLHLATTGYLLFHQSAQLLRPVAAAVPISDTTRFWSFKTEELDHAIEEINGEHAKLDEHRTDLEKIAARVKAERAELEQVRADIQASRDELKAAIIELQASELKNLKPLAQTYATMSPVAAVGLFREMDDASVVKILALMKPDKVALILQEMSRAGEREAALAKRAAVFSEKLRLLRPAKKENS